MEYTNTNHVSVNLNEEEVVRAMLLLADIPNALKKVTSAYIHAHSFYKGQAAAMPKFLQAENILKVFQAIGNLPNLKSLTVDFNYFAALPIEALAMALMGNNQLESLDISRLQFAGSPYDLDVLKPALRNQHCLRSIQLKACRGNALVIESLLIDPPALTSVSLDGAGMMGRRDTMFVTATHAWARLLRSSPQLQSLSLVSLPQISDEHILALTKELSSGRHSSLKHLTIASSLLGEKSGKAISHMMRFNDTIEDLTLHIDWENYGHCVAKMLSTNYTLQSLDFRAYGDEDVIAHNVVKVATALKGKNHSSGQSSDLKKLRLCFEVDPNFIPERVMDAFSEALETNESLETLILTDSMEKRVLPMSMRTKMRLNRLGMHKLLCSLNDTDTPVNAVHNAFVEAVIFGKNDTSVVFELLSNHPVLCMAPLEESSSSTSSKLSLPSSYATKRSLRRHYSTPATVSIAPKTMTPGYATMTHSAKKHHHHGHKSFGKRVMSLFNPIAPSA